VSELLVKYPLEVNAGKSIPFANEEIVEVAEV
jgi:hypothetical protein